MLKASYGLIMAALCFTLCFFITDIRHKRTDTVFLNTHHGYIEHVKKQSTLNIFFENESTDDGGCREK